MTPSAIFAMVKDGVIICAVLFIGWFLVKSGEDRVTVKDMAALEARLTQNAQTETQWRNQKDVADSKLASDLAQINSTVSTQPKPALWVQHCSSGSTVPSSAGPTKSVDTGAGGSDAGTGTSSETINIRPAIDEVERHIETALAECRDMQASWPTNALKK